MTASTGLMDTVWGGGIDDTFWRSKDGASVWQSPKFR